MLLVVFFSTYKTPIDDDTYCPLVKVNEVEANRTALKTFLFSNLI